jgi:acylphosphatase
VEVYACGTRAQLDELNGVLYQGPRWADVHGVDITEAAPSSEPGFIIKG